MDIRSVYLVLYVAVVAASVAAVPAVAPAPSNLLEAWPSDRLTPSNTHSDGPAGTGGLDQRKFPRVDDQDKDYYITVEYEFPIYTFHIPFKFPQ